MRASLPRIVWRGGRRRAYHSPAGGAGGKSRLMDAAELIAELKRLHRQGKDSGSTFTCAAMNVAASTARRCAGWYAGFSRSLFRR